MEPNLVFHISQKDSEDEKNHEKLLKEIRSLSSSGKKRYIKGNPPTLRSDYHVTSPYNIHSLSGKQVMRILKLIKKKFVS